MTDIDILTFIKEIAPRHRARKLQKEANILLYLENLYPTVALNMQIHSLLTGISPFCKNCSNPVKTMGKETCSVRCRETLKITLNLTEVRVAKYKKTLIDRYGVDNPAKLEGIQKKRLDTMMEKYGALVSPTSLEKTKDRTDNLNTKGRETLFQRYGITNAGQLPNHKEKMVNTYKEKLGVTHYAYTAKYKALAEQKRLDKLLLFSPATIELCNITRDKEKDILFDNPNIVVNYKCLTCNKTDSLPSETYKWRIRETGTPCLICSGVSKGSLKEIELKNFIKSLGFNILENKRILNGLEIDILIPEKGIGIEFNGLFWHNDTRIDKNYHINKTNIAKEKNIRLIHIFEDEWDHKKDIVKSRLLNLLGVTPNKIYARKCEIKEISSTEERLFLENNHIQGYAKSSVKIGLYFNNELVSVMTFSKLNLSRGYRNNIDWELLRFSSLQNYSVAGGASKLLSYFIKKYNPEHITSYSDKRWNTGETYKAIGFEPAKDTSIGYWYINLKEIKRIHRFSMRKNETDDLSKTEYENRLSQGFLRIWDCGNSKWTWKSPGKKIQDFDK